MATVVIFRIKCLSGVRMVHGAWNVNPADPLAQTLASFDPYCAGRIFCSNPLYVACRKSLETHPTGKLILEHSHDRGHTWYFSDFQLYMVNEEILCVHQAAIEQLVAASASADESRKKGKAVGDPMDVSSSGDTAGENALDRDSSGGNPAERGTSRTDLYEALRIRFDPEARIL